MEDLRSNVINRRRRVNMSDVESMALVLSKSRSVDQRPGMCRMPLAEAKLERFHSCSVIASSMLLRRT